MISLHLVNYCGWFINWFNALYKYQEMNRETENQLHHIFWELIVTKRIKCSVLSDIIPELCSHFRMKHSMAVRKPRVRQSHIQKSTGLRCQRDRMTNGNKNARRPPHRGCWKQCSLKEFSLLLILRAHSAFWMVVFSPPHSCLKEWQKSVNLLMVCSNHKTGHKM